MSAPVVIMVEEASLRVVIDLISARMGYSHLVQVLEHQGKSDLEKSIPRKIKAWRSPSTPHFIITRDLDSANREVLKEKLRQLVPETARHRTKIRIIIPELECWYLGDANALRQAGLISHGVAVSYPKKSNFRNLCNLQNAKQEFFKLVNRKMGQIEAAQTIAPLMDPSRNCSVNFNRFIEAIEWSVNAATTDGQRTPDSHALR